MNFHSYGNLWIHPYNFSNSIDGFEGEKVDKEIIKFYKEFE